MRTSDEGILALLTHEGVVPAPYIDSVGVHTYGVGHTAAAGSPNPKGMPPGMPSNLDAELMRVFEVFRKDLSKYEADVNAAITADMSQTQFDAAVSFHLNTGGIHRASWVKKFNAGDVAGAGRGIMNWTKPSEIIPRRKAEQRLFVAGEYPETAVTVWGATNDRRVVWKPVKRLTRSEALGLIRGPIVHDDPQAPPVKHPAARVGLLVAAIISAIATLWAQFFGG